MINEILLLHKIRKIQESMKKISSNTQTPPKSDLVATKDKVTAVSNPVIIVENKVENNKKGPAVCDMGYGIIEDIKKTKENISLF